MSWWLLAGGVAQAALALWLAPRARSGVAARSPWVMPVAVVLLALLGTGVAASNGILTPMVALVVLAFSVAIGLAVSRRLPRASRASVLVATALWWGYWISRGLAEPTTWPTLVAPLVVGAAATALIATTVARPDPPGTARRVALYAWSALATLVVGLHFALRGGIGRVASGEAGPIEALVAGMVVVHLAATATLLILAVGAAFDALASLFGRPTVTPAFRDAFDERRVRAGLVLAASAILAVALVANALLRLVPDPVLVGATLALAPLAAEAAA